MFNTAIWVVKIGHFPGLELLSSQVYLVRQSFQVCFKYLLDLCKACKFYYAVFDRHFLTINFLMLKAFRHQTQ